MTTVINVTKTSYSSGGVIKPVGRVIISSNTIKPKCIVHHRFPVKGDVITYDPTACTRLADSAAGGFVLDSAGSFVLDSDGVPTITGDNGTLGYPWGVYACTFTFNGVEETKNISHSEDAVIRATFSFPEQDANGNSIITPSGSARLIYVSPTGNDSTWGVGAAGTTHYTMASQPTGGWEDPTSVNAFQTIAAAFAQMRDGTDDQILFEEGVIHALPAIISIGAKSGASATERLMFRTYGDHTARAHLNPSHNDLDGVFNVSTEAYVGFLNLDIYPTYKDPSHGDFAGYGNGNLEIGPAIAIYTGGYAVGGNTNNKGYLVENCRVRFCDSGVAAYGQAGLTDLIIRRNVIHECYNEDQHSQGISIGDQNDWSFYIGENVLDHNGWLTQTINVDGTATSGGTTTCTEVGAFVSTDFYIGVGLTDNVNGGFAEITGNTVDTLTFGITANVDFTGGGSYTIGGGDGQGQATIFNHNMYLKSANNCIIENNSISRASSIAIKLTADGQVYNQNCDAGGSTSSVVDADGGFVGLADNSMAGWYISDEDGGGNGIITTHSGSTVNFTITTGTMDFTSAGVEYLILEENVTYPTQNMIQQWNLGFDNELGMDAGGGNSPYQLRSRFLGTRVMDTVQINQGASNPTLRNVGRGQGLGDCIDSVIGNTINLKTPESNNNYSGYAFGEITSNSQLVSNIAYNLGPSTGADTTFGLMVVGSTNANYSDNYIGHNDFQDPDRDAPIYGDWPTAETANFTVENNRYYTARAAAQWGLNDAAFITYAQWLTESGETGSSNAAVNYLDTGASIENYQRTRGGTATQQAFIDELKGQIGASWDNTLDTEEVVAYFKTAFSDRPDIIFETTRVGISTGAVSTTQEIPFSNVGTPKAAIFIVTNSDANWGTHYALPGVGIGFTDGTNQWCTYFTIDPESVGPDQKCYSTQIDHAVIRRVQGTANEGVRLELEFTSWTDNSITLTVTEQDDPVTQDWDVIVIAIGGADVDAVVGNHNMGTGTTVQSVNAGHKTDMLYTASTLAEVIHDTTGIAGNVLDRADAGISHGVAIRTQDGSIEQMGFSRFSTDGTDVIVTPSESTVGFYDDSIMAKVQDGAIEDYAIAINAMTEVGFNLSQDAAGDSAIFGYLSLSFKNRPKLKMVNTTIPTANNYSIDTVGFKGNFGYWLNGAGVSAYNTVADESNSIGIAAFDGTNSYGYSFAYPDNITQDDATGQSYGNDEFSITNQDGTTSLVAVASGEVFTDSGIDWTLTTNPAGTIPGRILVIGGVN